MSRRTRQQKGHIQPSRSHSSSGEDEVGESDQMSSVLNEVKKQMKQQRELIKKLNESYVFMSDGFDKLNSEVAKLGKENVQIKKQMKKLKSNSDKLNQRVQLLERGSTKAKQVSNENHMIITNLPKVNDVSTLKALVVKLGEQVEHTIKEEDIVEVYQSENKRQTRHKSFPLIVKLVTAEFKKKCMQFRKDGKQIDLKAIFPNVQSSANVNFHHLIEKQYADLLQKAKECAKKKKYKFVWFSNSTVLVRKEEQSTIIQIRDESDLKKIV